MAVLTENIPEIRINGRILESYIVVDVFLKKELLRPNELRFSLRKKSLQHHSEDIGFELSDTLLGADVSMSVATSRQDASMNSRSEALCFEGIVFSAQSHRERMGQHVIIDVIAYSPDYLLVDNPHCISFENQTLNEIINTVASDYIGVINWAINPIMTKPIPYVVQYNETSYQFLSRLAQRYGEFFYYEDGKVHFGAPPEEAVISLYPDIDVLGYGYQLNMDHAAFSHAHHNYLQYSNLQAQGKDATSPISGNKLNDCTYQHSNNRYRKNTLQNFHAATSDVSSLDDQADRSVSIEGWGARHQMSTCHILTNRADLKMGSVVSIQEYTDDDSPILMSHEKMMVCGVNCHYTIDGHFENEVTTIPANTSSRNDYYAPYANCDLYPISESQRAKVIDNKDPEKLGRVRVQFLWQELQQLNLVSPWIRIAQPHGGNDKGFYFIPEIGEEVMVAFENGNAEKPYVVGTLYHGLQHPGGNWFSNSNDIKAIRTRNGHTVEIHDSGAGGYIRIYDHGKENYILTYSTDEKLIRLQSTGNIELEAQNNIILHAHNNIEMTADNNMTISVGNDRTINVANNDTESVGMNQTINIGNNKSMAVGNDEKHVVSHDRNSSIGNNDYSNVSENSVLAAKNIKSDSAERYVVYARQSEQKTDESIQYDGGNLVSIKGVNVKIN